MEKIHILCQRQHRLLAKADALKMDIPALHGMHQYLWCRHCKQEHVLDLYDLCNTQETAISISEVQFTIPPI